MRKTVFSILFLLCFAVTMGQGWLNKAIPDGRVDSVWQAINLDQAFTGKGVIIGVTDWGFDYTHPVFYDTNMVNYRVLRAWDQFKQNGPAPAGFNYGTEYVGREQLLAAQTDTANCYSHNYHGTHCASIAAGAGAGTQYRGVAFEADLLFASLYLDSIQRVMDTWNWMYNVAQEEGKRLIISSSWGLYYMDNMDGTGLLAQEMQRLTDLGVVFTVSAGNNGGEDFHLEHDFDNDTVSTLIGSPANNGHLWGSAITLMGTPGQQFAFGFDILDNNMQVLATLPLVATADNGTLDSFIVVNNDTIAFSYTAEASNPYNQRPQVLLKLQRRGSYRYVLTLAAEAGVVHAWNVAETDWAYGNWGGDFLSHASHPEWLAGDNRYGISTPANIDCAITVAAHSKRYMSPSGAMTPGDIADFSSAGPGFHNITKPEISAPGKSIIAAINSYTDSYTGTYSKKVTFNGRQYGFASLSGTSMSCPFVAGVAALVLQANPYLSASQVKDVLTSTAYNDSFTEEDGVERFGYGKVDAYQAVLEALNRVGVDDHLQVSENQYTIYPNPATNLCYITAKMESGYAHCQVFDLSGRMVLSEQIHPGVNNFSVSTLPSGCYLLRILDDDRVVTTKLIKQ